MQLVLNHAKAHTGMRLPCLNEVGDALSCAEMGICQHGVFLLVCPDQIADVFGCDGQDNVGCGDADSQGDGGAEQDVAVAGDDGAGHGCDKDVQRAGEDSLACFSGGRQRPDGAGEAVLEAEGLCQGVVDGLLAANRLPI